MEISLIRCQFRGYFAAKHGVSHSSKLIILVFQQAVTFCMLNFEKNFNVVYSQLLLLSNILFVQKVLPPR